jgi:hypothetical protein
MVLKYLHMISIYAERLRAAMIEAKQEQDT